MKLLWLLLLRQLCNTSPSMIHYDLDDIGTNLAYFGTAFQSSTFTDNDGIDRIASIANDGRHAPDGGGAITLKEDSPWWRLDLATPSVIHKIVVWNRYCGINESMSCKRRLSHSVIRILDTNGSVISEKSIGDVSKIDSLEFPFIYEDGVVGSAVEIKSPSKTILQLDEVEVFGFSTIAPQAGYFHAVTDPLAAFDWDVDLTVPIYVHTPDGEQETYSMETDYILDDRSYDVELYKKDCTTPPTPRFPLTFKGFNTTNYSVDNKNHVELFFEYNQTAIEASDLWKTNSTGRFVEFCIKINNFVPDNGSLFGKKIYFHETRYEIQVGTTSDNIVETPSQVPPTDIIKPATAPSSAPAVRPSKESSSNLSTQPQSIPTTKQSSISSSSSLLEPLYHDQDQLLVYRCDNSFQKVKMPSVNVGQGEFLQLCMETTPESSFIIDSIKEIDTELDGITFKYIENYVDSPLTNTVCRQHNQIIPVMCKARIQLLDSYFNNKNTPDIHLSGIVKLGDSSNVDSNKRDLSASSAKSIAGDRTLTESRENFATFNMIISTRSERRADINPVGATTSDSTTLSKLSLLIINSFLIGGCFLHLL